MTRVTTLLSIGLICGALPCSTAAQTGSSGGGDDASAHFDRGLALIEQRAFPEAVVQFERAYELSGDRAVLHNLGMAYAAADRPVEAVSALKRYLESDRAAQSEAEHTRIEAEIERQRARIGHLAIHVEPQGSSIEIDGRKVGTAPMSRELPLAAGTHRIDASHAGHQTATWTVHVAPKQSTTVLISLRPSESAPTAAVVSRVAEPAPPRTTRETDGGAQRAIGYVLGGTGIAAGVAASVLAVVSADRFDDWEREDAELESLRSASDAESELRRKDNDALLKSVWQMDALTWALAIGGTALLAGGVALVWTAPLERDATPTRLSLQGTRLVLDGYF